MGKVDAFHPLLCCPLDDLDRSVDIPDWNLAQASVPFRLVRTEVDKPTVKNHSAFGCQLEIARAPVGFDCRVDRFLLERNCRDSAVRWQRASMEQDLTRDTVAG
jgi:hypothetical protein